MPKSMRRRLINRERECGLVACRVLTLQRWVCVNPRIPPPPISQRDIQLQPAQNNMDIQGPRVSIVKVVKRFVDFIAQFPDLQSSLTSSGTGRGKGRSPSTISCVTIGLQGRWTQAGWNHGA